MKQKIWLITLGVSVLMLLTMGQGQAQQSDTLLTEPPFILPFAHPASLETWLMAQPYGNTTGAYFQRYTTYGASGGIHFGLDLAAPCGTEIVAIADGIVFAVDGPFGSPPHNLMIDHPQLGYASMYGHLLEAPALIPGQAVKQGEVIALSGASFGNCNRREHLHLEIRDLDHAGKHNPIPLIKANWESLAMQGDSGREFMRNLENPRQWQTLYDQPTARTGGPIVNDFVRTWPFDWEKPFIQPPQIALTPTMLMNPGPLMEIGPVQQLIGNGCCTNPFWSADSAEVRFIDRPTETAPVGIWAAALDEPHRLRLVSGRLGYGNQTGTLLSYPGEGGHVVIEQLADGTSWAINTSGHSLNFTPDDRLLWVVDDAELSWQAEVSQVWLADLDGSNARLLTTLNEGRPIAWLPDNKVLVAKTNSPTETETLLSTLSLADGALTDLTQITRARSLSLNPNRTHLLYMVRLNDDPVKNGLWLLNLESPELSSQRLPFFGAYRWRDATNLLYIPFDPSTTEQVIHQYNVESGLTQRLLSLSEYGLTITNNDWTVSPDGQKIALVAAKNNQLNGIWVVRLDMVTTQ